MDQIKEAVLGQIVQAIPVLFVALTGAISAALVALAKKFNATANESKISQIGGRVAALADAVVHDLEYGLRPTMDGVTKDGILTTEEGQRLKSLALENLKRSLGEKGLKDVGFVLGVAAESVGTYLSGQIEAALNRLRGRPSYKYRAYGTLGAIHAQANLAQQQAAYISKNQ